MKIKRISVFLIIVFILGFLGVVKIYAQQGFPTITTACEGRNGLLYSFNDGFSNLKKCPGNSRRVVLIGAPGLKGDKGDKGDPGEVGPQGYTGEIGFTGSVGLQGLEGPQGPTGSTGLKGDPGDAGYTPAKEINVCFNVPTGNLRVLRGTTCFPDVRWTIPVKCVSGEPCKPDNPSDPYYINNN